MKQSLDPEFPSQTDTDELILSEYGTAGKIMALGVKGSNKFLRQTENMLINFGIIGTNAQYHPMYSNFGYFVVDVEKLEYGMQNVCMVDYWMENRKITVWDDILAGVGREEYLDKAKKWFNSIKREDFMQYMKGSNNHFFYSKMYKAS